MPLLINTKEELGLKENIYSASPLLLQNAMVSIYGYYWKRRRFGGVFEKELKEFKEREGFTVEQIKTYQTLVLRKLLVHAFQYVPFYHAKYKGAGFKLQDFENFELSALKELPFLEKEELRLYGRSSLMAVNKSKNGEFYSSSGSTGTPVSIFLSESVHQQISAAYEARVRHWAGLNNEMPRGMIGGRRILPDAIAKPPYYRYNLFEKQVYFSAYHIGADTVSNYVEGMRKHNIQYMSGYAMSNFLLAQLLLEHNIEAPELNAVITSSEKLTDEMRSCFKKVYHCNTFDGYSGVENCGLISENEFNQKLISEDVGILEVIDTNGADALEGELISTGLINFDQPLIRYRIGDNIKLADNQNTLCGRNFRIVEEIVGRTEDVVFGADGRQMVRFHGIFTDIENLERGQIIQHQLDEIEIVLQTIKGITTSQTEVIIKRLKSQLGDVKINITQTSMIPLTQNGKFKAVISKLKQK